MTWINQYWQDLQPTPGRLGTSLRIVLATIIALILMMTWQIPASAYGLYIVFMIARDSPSISVRAGILSVVGLCVAVATELAIVIVTNNHPMPRVLAVPIIAFVAGMAMRATTISNLAVSWGFIVCTLIANWEFHTPAEAVVKNSMWLAGAGTISISCSVAVEYMFGETNPVARLQEQLRTRYQAFGKPIHVDR
jgi:multidrug resistance protein MdtO